MKFFNSLFCLTLVLSRLAFAEPSFRQMMDDAEFEAGFQQLLADVDLAKIETSAKVGEGLRILNLTPGGQAEALGIEPGDFVVEVAGTKLWRSGQDWKRREANRKLEVLKANGERRTYTIEPGLIGVNFDDLWDVAREHFRSHGSDAPAHDLVIGAIALMGRDPDVAEAAMHRALAAGYLGGKVAAAVGIEVAIRQNRPGVAWEFAQQLLDESGKPSEELEPGYRTSLVRAAFVNSKADFFRQVTQLDWGAEAVWKNDGIVESWDALDPPEHGGDPAKRPSERIHLFGLRDRTLSTEMVDDGDQKPWAWPQRRNQNQSVDIDRGHWARGYSRVSDGVSDCVWDLEFTATRSQTNLESRWGSVVRMYLQKLGDERDDDRIICGISLLKSNDRIEIRSSGYGGIGDTDWEWADPRVHVRLIKLGNEVECQLNGSTVLWMPVEADAKDIAIRFVMSGMIIESHKWRLFEIVNPNDDDETN